MSRTTYVWNGKKMVLKKDVPRVSAGPSIIGDIQDVRSMLDG